MNSPSLDNSCGDCDFSLTYIIVQGSLCIRRHVEQSISTMPKFILILICFNGYIYIRTKKSHWYLCVVTLFFILYLEH
jgi:hypothetical protein